MMYTDGIHLISSESLEELHAFAIGRLGLKPSWLHNSPRHPHYDLMTEAAVQRALHAGARLRSSRDLVQILRKAPYLQSVSDQNAARIGHHSALRARDRLEDDGAAEH